MNFSIIGTGFIFPRHAQAIYDVGGKIIDVVNTAHGEDTWRTMVKKTNADCIVILTPNDLHFEMALASAEEGKIVLSEKSLAIKSEHARILARKPNIFTVLQLRHHPLVKELKQTVSKKKSYDIEMDISVFRDKNYYTSWKGIKERSGGLLFNLGIHYFDLLEYLFGPAIHVATLRLNDKTGSGIIKGKNYVCNWRVSSDEKRDKQRRVFTINGELYNFSSQDNLSYENLHRYVYQNLIKRKGVLPHEVGKSIELVEKLYAAYKT